MRSGSRGSARHLATSTPAPSEHDYEEIRPAPARTASFSSGPRRSNTQNPNEADYDNLVNLVSGGFEPAAHPRFDSTPTRQPPASAWS